MIASELLCAHRRLSLALATAAVLLVGSAVGAPKAQAMVLAVQDDAVFLQGRYYDRELAFTHARDLGAKVVRVNFVWADYKRYGFRQLDAFVNSARRRGFQVSMTTVGTSQYHRTGNRQLNYRNPNVARYGAWMKQIARRYRRKVSRYGCWNEPQMPYFLSPTSRAPAIYRALYLACYRAIKSQDRGAKVLIGELAPRRNPMAFLRRVVGRGGLRADGLAYHPFQFFVAPGARDRSGLQGISATPTIKRTLRSLRRGLRTPGGATLPIYFTEFAYISCCDVRMPESRRADWIAKAWHYARRQGVKEFLYYQLIHAPSFLGIGFDSGIIDLSGRPNDSYYALRRAVTGR